MDTSRECVISVMILLLISNGCETGRSVTVAEYRPSQPIISERRAPRSEVFQLVRWQPVAPTTAAAARAGIQRPARQIPVEMERRYLDRGQPLGFARVEGQLVAIAGDMTTPLVDAHYEWKSVLFPPTVNSHGFGRCMGEMGGVAVVAIGVVLIGGLVFLGVHESRHHLLDFDNE